MHEPRVSSDGNSRSLYAPLHLKSHYSLGVGTASPQALVERAAGLGIRALALTDLENLYGQVEFHHACRERGLRPITGVELRRGFEGASASGGRVGRLVLLARDGIGYANLCRIVSRRRAASEATSETHPAPEPLRSLQGDTRGLFMLTDDAAACRRLLERAGTEASDLGLLLVRPRAADAAEEDEAELLALSRGTGVPLVADIDGVMAGPDELELHLLLTAVRRGETVGEAGVSGEVASAERYLRAPEAVDELFADLPEAVENARAIAGACELDLTRAPPADPTSGGTSEERGETELERLCREALRTGRAAGRWEAASYERRMEAELGTIGDLKLRPYFLVVATIAAAAKERGIGLAVRGSAASSLVLHVLGLTEVDPLEQGLYFERFLHPSRAEPPDIDLDVASDRRDELIEWVYRRFGRDRVAMVSAHHRFRRRSAYREGLKALGMPPEHVRSFAERLSGPGESHRDHEPRLPERYAPFRPLIERVVGTPRHLSVHPGGIVIAETEIAARAPLERAPKGVVVTQYDMRSLRSTGLVKIDLLGSRCLSELSEAIELVRGRAGPEALRTIPDEDPATLRTLDRARTVGCFQVESPAVRSTLRKLPVRDAGDLIDALALVRPGAASGDARERFLRRARRIEPAEFPHPRLETALRGTHGVLLYEEDVLAVLIEVLGVSAARADEMRSAITASADEPQSMKEIRASFLARATDNGFSAASARRIWRGVRKFAAYSFSRAHAASHGLLAYRAAYMKTHFPVEFGCALLNHHGGTYPLRSIAAEIERSGVRILPPCVNRSRVPCSVEERGPRDGQRSRRSPSALESGGDDAPDRGIRVGLSRLKGISRESVLSLLEAREREGAFRSVDDLRRRASLRAGELEILVLSGACDRLPLLSREAYPFAHEALLERIPAGDRGEREAVGEVAIGRRRGGGPPAPGSPRRKTAPASGDERVARYRALVRIRNELKHLGMHVEAHPMEVLRGEARRHDCVSLAEALEMEEGFVRVAGILAASRRVRTSGGNPMQFLTLEDETGLLEAVLFPAVYEEVGERVTTPGPYLVAGSLQEEHGDVHLTVARLLPFHERGEARARGRLQG